MVTAVSFKYFITLTSIFAVHANDITCPKGYFITAITDDGEIPDDASCAECPPETFNDIAGQTIMKCADCHPLFCHDTREKETTPCSPTTNRVCECAYGYYRNRSGEGRCVKTTWTPRPSASPGENTLIPTTYAISIFDKTSSKTNSASTYSTLAEERSTSGHVIVIVVLCILLTFALMAAVAIIIYFKICKGSNPQPSGEEGIPLTQTPANRIGNNQRANGVPHPSNGHAVHHVHTDCTENGPEDGDTDLDGIAAGIQTCTNRDRRLDRNEPQMDDSLAASEYTNGDGLQPIVGNKLDTETKQGVKAAEFEGETRAKQIDNIDAESTPKEPFQGNKSTSSTYPSTLAANLDERRRSTTQESPNLNLKQDPPHPTVSPSVRSISALRQPIVASAVLRQSSRDNSLDVSRPDNEANLPPDRTAEVVHTVSSFVTHVQGQSQGGAAGTGESQGDIFTSGTSHHSAALQSDENVSRDLPNHALLDITVDRAYHSGADSGDTSDRSQQPQSSGSGEPRAGGVREIVPVPPSSDSLASAHQQEAGTAAALHGQSSVCIHDNSGAPFLDLSLHGGDIRDGQ